MLFGLLIVIITPALVFKVRILFRLEHSVLEKIFAKSWTQRYGHRFEAVLLEMGVP